MALTIATWLWGNKYGIADVAKLAASVKRNLWQPHRFLVISDRDVDLPGVESYQIPRADRHLLEIQGCFVRLRMFDPRWQKLTRITERLVCMDLDSVVTGSLDPLFLRAEQFLILQGANASNPCPYNGSLIMLRAGYRPDVWETFSIGAAETIARHEFPDDQGWLWHKLPGANGWKVGPQSGVYAFKKPGWPKGNALPADARLVVFPGWRDPKSFSHLAWIKQCWRP